MCGILLRISNKSVEIPTCIPSTSFTTHNDIFQTWETQDPEIINQFLVEGSKLKPLTKQQLFKLNNLDYLRELNAKLSKIKNNVKLPAEVKKFELDSIQSEIDTLTKEDDDDDDEVVISDDINDLIYKVSNRGPDYLNYTQFKYDQIEYQSFSSILSLRQPFTKQPILRDQFILQFNGELYNQECLETNDTQFIIDTLHSQLERSEDRKLAILSTLRKLQGEFAVILIDVIDEKVYFGRDSIGKRSLCYKMTSNEIVISSVGTDGFIDCKNEIYEYDVQNHGINIYHLHNPPIPCPSNPDNIDEERLLTQLYDKLKQSTQIRQESIHPISHHANESTLAVLFSGGLDCTIIAGLICQHLSNTSRTSTIDLLTVGFENPRTGLSSHQSPDRKLATKSWFHLSKQFPGLQIQLVEINVDYQSWLGHKSRVLELMYPQNTEMDLSIAIAFYFASSKLPELTTMKKLINYDIDWETFESNPEKYVETKGGYFSDSKVLFSGLGADELFAGYSRHESIFTTLLPDTESGIVDEKYEELTRELMNDIQIIHVRNLGRDDRVMSCWGKELRYPYLDESFISWVVENVPGRMKFRYGFEMSKKGVVRLKPVRKYALRELAKRMGLGFVAEELKRAIQFGAKSAKMEIGQSKVKGTDSL
ncbi:uncharacterized protein J8A68_003646 [[Candida] subhashii]|uniref:Glutamine amidotransferase type-2 domain-containing protein n=1 Tax=[Candida] subhashii TaxID=561895 RepID=A0A8J5QV92_9ASCO|nr:uncharacterized protein J8A68_003646 [[Candida] subhashii]KAG7662875.1 hypothetical protein J8A68_003646 [[Candida] subhashii]